MELDLSDPTIAILKCENATSWGNNITTMTIHQAIWIAIKVDELDNQAPVPSVSQRLYQIESKIKRGKVNSLASFVNCYYISQVIDTIGIPGIYEKYMHSYQIAYTGKVSGI